MIKKNSLMPDIFTMMLASLSLIILVGMFFSVKIVGTVYFVALLVSIVFTILDKKYGKFLSNYKRTFFMFDIINVFSVIAIIYYEFSKNSITLNIFLVLLVVVEIFALLVDLFFVHNNRIEKQESYIVNVIKMCSMICVLTYFYKVSILFFAIDALIFECANLFIKFYINKEEKVEKKTENINVEDIIQSNQEEGEIE